MIGADADVLTATGRSFIRSSEALRRQRAQLASIFGSTAWVGVDAERSRVDWRTVNDPALASASEFIETLGTRLLEHAGEQQRASAGRAAGGGGFGLGLGGLDGLFDGFVDAVDEFLDDLFGLGDAGGEPLPATDEIIGLRPTEFPAPADGRAALLMAMSGLSTLR